MKRTNGHSRKPPLPGWITLVSEHCGHKLSPTPGRPPQRLLGWLLYLGNCPACDSTFTVKAEKDI